MSHEYDIWTVKVLKFLENEKDDMGTPSYNMSQDQRSLHDQLKDLMEIARIMKMYDARDFLNIVVNKGK